MTTAKKISGIVLAAAAAGMFATMPVAHAAKHEGKVMCEGVNACKGKGACKTAANACKGQNACKGKGAMEMTMADCTAKGGKTAK